MKKNPLLYGILAISIALTTLSLIADDDNDAPDPRQQWQHLALSANPRKGVKDPELSEKIVDLGNDGWELVTVLNFTRDGTTYQTVYYFKKPQ